MRIRRRTTVAALAALTLGLVVGPQAQASLTYTQVESFGGGQVEHPVGVAVSQASGNVYVASFLSRDRLNEFSAAGSILSPPSPFGDGMSGEAEEYFSGLAIDPVDGNLYAVTALPPNQEIQTYDGRTGSLLSELSVANSGALGGEFTVVQIASDAAGNVYFPNAREDEIQEFSPAGSPLQTFSGSGANALSEPTGVAVDAAGNVFVADGGNGRIEEFSSTGAPLGSIASPGVQALALDASGDIFAGELNSEDACGALPSPCFHVVVDSSAGAKLGDFGAGTIGSSEFGAINTLALGPNGWLYVTDGGVGVVRAYAQEREPLLLSVSSSAVTQTSAELIARIDPHNGDTTYDFEYGTSAGYGASVPVPGADIGEGLQGPVVVGQLLTGLRPDTTYHYRVVASNALGRAVGPDRTFTTSSPRPPILSTGQARAVAQNSATLTATIETQGFQTTYEFDLGVDTSYGSRIFGDAGSEPGTQTFTADLQGLAPGETYHYRIVARNTFGASYGVDQTFTTATYPSSTLTAPGTPALVPAPLLATAANAIGTTGPAHTASVRPAARPKPTARPARHAKARTRGQRPRGRQRTDRQDGAGRAPVAADRGRDK